MSLVFGGLFLSSKLHLFRPSSLLRSINQSINQSVKALSTAISHSGQDSGQDVHPHTWPSPLSCLISVSERSITLEHRLKETQDRLRSIYLSISDLRSIVKNKLQISPLKSTLPTKKLLSALFTNGSACKSVKVWLKNAAYLNVKDGRLAANYSVTVQKCQIDSEQS